MTIEREIRSEGQWLFRWRSYVPLVLLVPGALVALNGFSIEKTYGEDAEDIWVAACFCISLLGVAVRCLTVGYIATGTSGRNTTHQRADFLNTTGMYSVCRNPLYLGNFLGVFGVVMAFQSAWFAAFVLLIHWLYIERIIAAEEEFLIEKFDETFKDYASRTPVFFPKFSLWKSSDLSFSVKTVLKREYNGFLALFVAYYSVEFISDVLIEAEPFKIWMRRDWIWSALLGLGVTSFLVLRTLKKHTRLLKTEGR